jgi:hypothetical protein
MDRVKQYMLKISQNRSQLRAQTGHVQGAQPLAVAPAWKFLFSELSYELVVGYDGLRIELEWSFAAHSLRARVKRLI